MDILLDHWHCIIPAVAILLVMGGLPAVNWIAKSKKHLEVIKMSDKTKKISKKQTNVLRPLAVVAVVICIAVVFLVNRNGTSNESSDVSRKVNGADTIVAGGSLVIPTADITSEASFFPVEVDGTNMEVVAVRDSAGDIRTAFNTCQICYDSGRGYYVQSGDHLVCQNCGSRFSVDQVEIESGGCNPWPIFDENKTVNDDEISISYDFLVDAQGIFENWKGDH